TGEGRAVESTHLGRFEAQRGPTRSPIRWVERMAKPAERLWLGRSSFWAQLRRARSWGGNHARGRETDRQFERDSVQRPNRLSDRGPREPVRAGAPPQPPRARRKWQTGCARADRSAGRTR